MRTIDWILLLGVALVAGLLVWIWFWPAIWWKWLEAHSNSGLRMSEFLRSAPALGLCGVVLPAGMIWLFSVIDPADANRRGPLTAQFFLVAIPVLSPWLLWIAVYMFGWPEILLPPGARRPDADRADRQWAVQHPVRFGLCVLAGGGVAVTNQGIIHGYWTMAAVGSAMATAAFWVLNRRRGGRS